MATSYDRMEVFEERWTRFLSTGVDPASGLDTQESQSLTENSLSIVSESRAQLRHIVFGQLISRRLDRLARQLKRRGHGYYTIASSGHEGNALVAAALKRGDPAYLHYRSGPFMAVRALQGAASFEENAKQYIWDTVRSFVASACEPVSGGRHKVWGCVESLVIPQTSTIASHLSKTLGVALAIDRIRRSQLRDKLTDRTISPCIETRDSRAAIAATIRGDAIAVCSFGDASFNHSSAQGAINAVSQTAFRGIRVPLLFVCEDNGIGISVQTPKGWIAASARRFAGLRYEFADGSDIIRSYQHISNIVSEIRETGNPVFLHLKTERLFGHAGSDFERAYRSMQEIEDIEAQDPLMISTIKALSSGCVSLMELRKFDDKLIDWIADAERRCVSLPKLTSLKDVTSSLFRTELNGEDEQQQEQQDEKINLLPANQGDHVLLKQRREVFRQLPENQPPKHMASLINWSLKDLMIACPEALIFGEDVGAKGGVYHVTEGLQSSFGVSRVFDTLLDEQTILGLAQGYAQLGFLPIVEIQYLAYLYNAIDQLRGEACSTQYFSNGRFSNPMVIRIAGLAYQKGFGGHFHNDNGFASLREIPGLVIAIPSRGDDAVHMLRSSVDLARRTGRVVAFIEPIARYMTKDLYAAGDKLWSDAYPAVDAPLQAFGTGRTYSEHQCSGKNMLVITYGNGTYMSLRAAKTFREQIAHRASDHGDRLGVIIHDLRWVSDYDQADLMALVQQSEGIVVVDEGREAGGVWEHIVAKIALANAKQLPTKIVVGENVYIPLGPAANLVLPTEDKILAALNAVASCVRDGKSV